MSGRTGVLLHPTALPGPGGCGTLGRQAHDWLSLLGRHGIGVWQLLPLAPPDGTGSPYSSPSGSALNPWLLDRERLLEQGFLDPAGGDGAAGEGPDAEVGERLDPALQDRRSQALGRALAQHWPRQSPQRQRALRRWCRQERFWLRDHCRYMVLRRQQDGRPWWQWPEPLARRWPGALRRFDREHRQELLAETVLQWLLQQEWQALRRHAEQEGVSLFGDLPFYVAHDSADVWSHPGLFSLAPRAGGLEEQSGVPPDYFSATGQLWGTPVYRWRRHLLTGFGWWLGRLRRQLELFDLLRLDHFRALEAYWSVPGEAATAQDGRWRSAPGHLLLSALWLRLALSGGLLGGRLPLVAEDLGVITPAVEALRDRHRLPGMKILQFAFDGNHDNPYLPANIHGSDWVVYTGTHDNATAVGWWQGLDGEVRQRVETVLGAGVNAPGWQLLELALSTPAELVVVPLQDLLELGDEARFNTPGTLGANWTWRLTRPLEQLDGPLKGYGELASRHSRSA
ncbi:4-alpha-glucanotransferase [Cyanobium sp. ATX 6A2]|uniref:4-alpha-glucanotransferase n=1 Tax=Cyanobium sp. ATX 6A2 TaxID=2823700 RepID=UPI0020CF32F8|nr:4-alpha-glucanotransferase [Cyanobium sp. ATX 6A2]